jgi:hypothetical protein
MLCFFLCYKLKFKCGEYVNAVIYFPNLDISDMWYGENGSYCTQILMYAGAFRNNLTKQIDNYLYLNVCIILLPLDVTCSV